MSLETVSFEVEPFETGSFATGSLAAGSFAEAPLRSPACTATPSGDTARDFPAIAPAILDTILAHLAMLFLEAAGGHLPTARHAASRMLADYQAETLDELRLAAEIISFGFHALEALGQASTPDMALTRILRLRGSAVSLSRESHKAQRKLEQLQRDRRAGVVRPTATQEARTEPPAPPPSAEPARPRIDKAIGLVETTREAIASAGKPAGTTWTQSYRQRQVDKRLAARAISP